MKIAVLLTFISFAANATICHSPTDCTGKPRMMHACYIIDDGVDEMGVKRCHKQCMVKMLQPICAVTAVEDSAGQCAWEKQPNPEFNPNDPDCSNAGPYPDFDKK